MTLLELTEPLFQYICRLNRLGKRSGTAGAAATATRPDTSFFAKPGAARGTPGGGALDYQVARSEIKGLFDEMKQKSNSDLRLSTQLKKMELPLLFFVDSMISESKLAFAGQWNQSRLAYDLNELAGDEKFFDLLDETLKDPGDDASERLAVFYLCLGLGFTGVNFNQPEYLRKMMLTIAPRILHLMDRDATARICPESYEGVDTRNLVQPPGSRLTLLVIIFICFTVAIIAAYAWMRHSSSKELSRSLQEILRQDLSAPQ